LQEAQQIGQFAEQNLTREGSDEDQRDAVETKCIEGEYRFGVKKTRQSENLGASVLIQSEPIML
jgi:hypothetical protein